MDYKFWLMTVFMFACAKQIYDFEKKLKALQAEIESLKRNRHFR